MSLTLTSSVAQAAVRIPTILTSRLLFRYALLSGTSLVNYNGNFRNLLQRNTVRECNTAAVNLPQFPSMKQNIVRKPSSNSSSNSNSRSNESTEGSKMALSTAAYLVYALGIANALSDKKSSGRKIDYLNSI